jgi:hypothetical protein
MTGFSNPFKPRGGAGYADALQRIRSWTTAALPAGTLPGDDPTISITELNCAEPGCPPRETVILVMWPDAPAWKLRVHKAMPDVEEGDVLGAMPSRQTVG